MKKHRMKNYQEEANSLAEDFVKRGLIPSNALALGQSLVEHLEKEDEAFYELSVHVYRGRNKTEVTMHVQSDIASCDMRLMSDGKWNVDVVSSDRFYS